MKIKKLSPRHCYLPHFAEQTVKHWFELAGAVGVSRALFNIQFICVSTASVGDIDITRGRRGGRAWKQRWSTAYCLARRHTDDARQVTKYQDAHAVRYRWRAFVIETEDENSRDDGHRRQSYRHHHKHTSSPTHTHTLVHSIIPAINVTKW